MVKIPKPKHTFVPFPKGRLASIDFIADARRQDTIYALVEYDVTKPRQLMLEQQLNIKVAPAAAQHAGHLEGAMQCRLTSRRRIKDCFERVLERNVATQRSISQINRERRHQRSNQEPQFGASLAATQRRSHRQGRSWYWETPGQERRSPLR